MRTAIRNDPRTRIFKLAFTVGASALVTSTTACAEPRVELSELQRDHEDCLVSEEVGFAEVRYADYQACMSAQGWSDPDLSRHS